MGKIYEHLIKNLRLWPINIFHDRRDEFRKDLNNFVFKRFAQSTQKELEDLISKTIYLERQRVKNSKWKVDPADEDAYWIELGKDLNLALNHDDKVAELQNIVKRIINRYNKEIIGDFKVKTFLFARKFLTLFYKILFNSFSTNGRWFWGRKKDLLNKINFEGFVEEARSLYSKGRLVVVPTHYSNLDSIMVGYCVDQVAGIPAFIYGAGLNLYNAEIAGYYMNRLGAYRVDRRKKNPIYLECLTSMVTFSLQNGVNNIFFPGGTRSRSGSIDSKLKLGLLGATVEAQRQMLETPDKEKIFIVPLTMSYHFVLEARDLADQHLRDIMQDKYVRSRDTHKSLAARWKIFKQFFSRESELHISFGEPMDIMGNHVDGEGRSYDKNGNHIELSDYFKIDSTITKNQQREGVYTKLLGERIADSFYRNTYALSSSLVAFTAFKIIEYQRRDQDVASIIKFYPSEISISRDVFLTVMGKLLSELRFMESKNQIKLSPILKEASPEIILEDGLHFIGIYHAERALMKINENELGTENLRLLFYYHNRLLGYEIENKIDWKVVSQLTFLQKLSD